MLNKFVSRFTDGFCNLFFISIRTPYATLHLTPDMTPKILHPGTKQGLKAQCFPEVVASCPFEKSLRNPLNYSGWTASP
jgi:hypothetical protein